MAGEANPHSFIIQNYYSLHTCNLQQSILPSSVRNDCGNMYTCLTQEIKFGSENMVVIQLLRLGSYIKILLYA